MHATPKRRARAPHGARLELVDPRARRDDLGLQPADLQLRRDLLALRDDLLAQRAEELRRERLAIELRAIADLAKCLELGVDHPDAPAQFRPCLVIPALDGRAV